jgi:hypothetical protein
MFRVKTFCRRLNRKKRMQNMWFLAMGQFRSGLGGIAVPRERDVRDEQQIVRWLNDEWIDPEPEFHRWKRGESSGLLPAMPNDEDVPARTTILQEFLPRLLKVQNMPPSATEALERGKLAMKQFPTKYRNLEHAAHEVGGFQARADLVRMLREHVIVPVIPGPGQTAMFMANGKNMTEVWAMHVLLRMAFDGVLTKLAPCACDCGKWHMQKRRVDKFASDSCRVRFHQRDPAVKEQRRAKARDRYHLERKGKLMTGWKKDRKVATRGKA